MRVAKLNVHSNVTLQQWIDYDLYLRARSSDISDASSVAKLEQLSLNNALAILFLKTTTCNPCGACS